MTSIGKRPINCTGSSLDEMGTEEGQGLERGGGEY